MMAITNIGSRLAKYVQDKFLPQDTQMSRSFGHGYDLGSEFIHAYSRTHNRDQRDQLINEFRVRIKESAQEGFDPDEVQKGYAFAQNQIYPLRFT